MYVIFWHYARLHRPVYESLVAFVNLLVYRHNRFISIALFEYDLI
jgi:hypothetical protein